MPETVEIWKSHLKSRPQLAETIADPGNAPQLFEEDWEATLEREQSLANTASPPPLLLSAKVGDAAGEAPANPPSDLTTVNGSAAEEEELES